MTKTLNQIIFFPPPKSEYFFSNIGNQNIFLEKNHNPPLEVKWSILNHYTNNVVVTPLEVSFQTIIPQM
jgi:hypothetical protein